MGRGEKSVQKIFLIIMNNKLKIQGENIGAS